MIPDTTQANDLVSRKSPLNMDADEFRSVGHEMVDRIADFWAGVREQPVNFGDDPEMAWGLIGRGAMPENGTEPMRVLSEGFDAMAAGSLLNGHPKFFGYITSSATPIGVISDMVAASFNPNCGGWPLSPVASAIEMQSVQWISELIGFSPQCGGLLCSGGNVANMLGYWAARRHAFGENVRINGFDNKTARVYAPDTTHTWLQKAADLSGLGTENVVMVATDRNEKMIVSELRQRLISDLRDNLKPFLVVASGGTVGTGAVDDIVEISKICLEHGIWLHIDGAYGAPAACLENAPIGLKNLQLADSIALDPHKWLYAPLEAGCVLVKDKTALRTTYGYRPSYYEFHLEDSEDWCNFYELGIQNSRGFRALKVWAALRQAGRKGYVESIGQDVRLANAMAEKISQTQNLELHSCQLSIVCFRYIPDGISPDTHRAYVNRLNKAILAETQNSGEGFVSNAVVDGVYYLRACIVNFRTQLSDVYEVVELCRTVGQRLDATLR